MSKPETFDDSWSVRDGYARIQGHRTNGGDYWYEGDVVGPDVSVGVYSDARLSHYSIVIDGKEYRRTEQRGRTQRGLTIMARKFADAMLREREADQ